jgi:RNA polymerase sigma factor (sigma-70 family)
MRSDPVLAESQFRSHLRSARLGGEEGWRSLYEWLAPQVLGYLRAIRVPDPEDVLGDVFLDVARNIERFKGDSRSFRAWVFTIARARRVDEIRRQARRSELPIDAVVEETLHASDDVEAQALAMVGLDDLLRLLDQLTDDQSEVLVLRALGGWTSKQVAAITNRTVGSVEQLQHRATRALRALLEDP